MYETQSKKGGDKCVTIESVGRQGGAGVSTDLTAVASQDK